MALKEQHLKFLDFYIMNGNATESAKLAGYSGASARTTGYKILKNPEAQAYLDSKMEKMENAYSENIASATEVLEFLTYSMRNTGFKAQDRIKSAELLGKKYKLFTDKVDVETKGELVIFEGEGELED
ncbi:MAG: terminase small subunit [Cetobacterium sp.]|uniref:terminase small subunit n=1 Tax=Cetobacterium sp. TaxID=2071632 RepID=UPI003F35FD85